MVRLPPLKTPVKVEPYTLVSMVPFAAAAYLWGPVSVIVVLGCAALSLLVPYHAGLLSVLLALFTVLHVLAYAP